MATAGSRASSSSSSSSSSSHVDARDVDADAMVTYAMDACEEARRVVARLSLENDALRRRRHRRRLEDGTDGETEEEGERDKNTTARDDRAASVRALEETHAREITARDDALARARDEISRLTAQMTRERGLASRAHAAKIGELRRESDARERDARREAMDRAEARMERSVKRIVARHDAMRDELRTQASASDVLQARCEAATREATRLRARATAAEEAERERDAVGAMRARELRRAEAKIEALERGVREVTRAFDAGRAAWRRERETARRASEEEVAHLRRALEVKSRELDTVRKLAKEVVCHYEDA